MTWTTFNTKSNRGGPYAVTPDRLYQSELILLQCNETGRTRAVLGFLVGVEYVPAEQIPGWAGEMCWAVYSTLPPLGSGELSRSVPGTTFRVDLP